MRTGKYIKKISDYSIAGSLSALVILSLMGCDTKKDENTLKAYNQQSDEGSMVVVEEVAKDQYKITNEYKSDTNVAVVKKLDGSETVLKGDEIKKHVDSGSPLGGALGSSLIGGALGYWAMSSFMPSSRENYYRDTSSYNRSNTMYQEKEEKKRSGGVFVAPSAAYAGSTSSSSTGVVSKTSTSSSASAPKSSGFFGGGSGGGHSSSSSGG